MNVDDDWGGPNDYMTGYQAPYRAWARERLTTTDPRPDARHWREPVDIEDVYVWFSHPANWTSSVLYVLKWGPTGPMLSASHVWRIAPGNPARFGLLDALLWDVRNKRRPTEAITDEQVVVDD